MYKKEIDLLNNLIKEGYEGIKLPFLVEHAIDFKNIELKDLSVSFVRAQLDYEDLTVITHTFVVTLNDESNTVEEIKMDSIHYDAYSIEYEEHLYETDNYKIRYYEEDIEVTQSKLTSEVVLALRELFHKIKYVEKMHDELYLTHEIVKIYADDKANSLKNRVLKWFPFSDIEYDGNRVVFAKFDNGGVLRLDFHDLMGQVERFERKEKTSNE